MNTEELNELIALYGKDIFSFCAYLTKNTYEAEELYQDTFLKAFQVLDRIEANNNPKGYLTGMAIRLWKNRQRKAAWRLKIAPVESSASLDESICYDGETPESSTIKLEETNRVRSAVGKLNDKLRIPVLLFYSMDLGIEEISKILKIPQGTVKSRLYSARKILKDRLEADINE